jgi:hypothetical protein
VKEIITRGQADLLFEAILVLGLILLPTAAVIARSRGRRPLLAALTFGSPPVLIGILWRVYNAITDRIGLDTVANLLVNLILFVAVGAACGVGWVLLTRQQQGMDGTPSGDTPDAGA